MKRTVAFVVLIEILFVFLSKTAMFIPFIGLLDASDRQIMLSLIYDGGLLADIFWKSVSSRISCLLIVLCALSLAVAKCRCSFKERLAVILFLLIVLTLCDQLSASFLKPYFARLRPSHDAQLCTMLHYVDGYRGGRYGFVSSHAANVFGVTTFMAMFFKNKLVTISLLIWSLCVCYSRIYLGVHYLGDVLGGCILGTTIGMSVYLLLQTVSEIVIYKLTYK